LAFPLLSAVGIDKQHVVADEQHFANEKSLDIEYETLPGVCRRVPGGRSGDGPHRGVLGPTPEGWKVEIAEDDKLGFSWLATVPFERLRAPNMLHAAKIDTFVELATSV